MRAFSQRLGCLGLIAWLVLAPPAAALRIVTEDWPPLSGAHRGIPDGMVGAIVQEIQARLKDRTPVELVPWARGYQTALRLPDVMLFPTLHSPEREKHLTLIGPVASLDNVLFARRGSPLVIRSLEDAKRVKRIATQRDTSYLSTLRQLGFTNLDISSSPQTSARKLLAGRVELWSDSSLTVPHLLREIGHRPDEVERKLLVKRQDLYLAFSRGTPASTIQRWLGALRAMEQDGTLGRIRRQWAPQAIPSRKVGLVGLPPGSPMPD